MQSESDVQLQGLMKACSAIEGFAAAAVARARSGGVVPMEVLSSLPCSRETIAYVVEVSFCHAIIYRLLSRPPVVLLGHG